ncbi:hypothetical protein [Gymnodinialimonas sp.]
MKRMTLAALAVLAATPMAQAQDHSAEAVASAILHAHRAQDVTLMLPHMNETNQRFVQSYAEDPSQFGDVFEGNRAQAGVAWDGMILPARYTVEPDGTFQAVIPFAYETDAGFAPLSAGGGRYIAVVLTLDGPDDTTWGFEDVNYVSSGQYGGLLDSL